MTTDCRACHGAGLVAVSRIPWRDPEPCPTCNGEGIVEAMCTCCVREPATIKRHGDTEFPEVCAECNAYINAEDAEKAENHAA